jgi:hypothetical protein
MDYDLGVWVLCNQVNRAREEQDVSAETSDQEDDDVSTETSDEENRVSAETFDQENDVCELTKIAGDINDS